MNLSVKNAKREEGFTLVELLVVILIIGILSSIALPAFLNQRKAAVDATVQSDVTNASTVIETLGIKSRGTVKKLPSKDDPAAKDIVVTDENTITVSGTIDDYCIQGMNTGGDTSAKGIVYSSLEGGINKTSKCDNTFVPSVNPSVNDTLVLKGSGAGNSDANQPVATTPPVIQENSATCDDIIFNSTEKTSLKCEKTSSNSSQDIFTVTISSRETTPIKWAVDINAARSKGYKKTDLYSVNTFDSYPVTTPQFTVKGTDRSWNHDPFHSDNHAYVSNLKKEIFTVQVTWK